MIVAQAEEIEMEKGECDYPDVMLVDVEWWGWKLRMILV